MYRTSMSLIILFGLLVSILPSRCFPQGAELQDVVYLKNGGVIRGVIIEQIPLEKLRIRTADGSIFVYQMSEIERITREAPFSTPAVAASPLKSKKDPALACLFSFFLPGTGQFYNGEAGKGAIMLGASAVGSILLLSSVADDLRYGDRSNDNATFGAVLFLSAWLWSVIDAPISASRINRQNGLASLPIIRDDVVVTLAGLSMDGKTTPGIRLSWRF
jgi:TM2 domain-containing membrane protein YozV